MTLAFELKAHFVAPNAVGYTVVDTMAEAKGVVFLCPQCFHRVGADAKGAHSVLCWFEGVDPKVQPIGGRWKATGTSLDDLTLTPSIQHGDPCRWHGYVRNGHGTLDVDPHGLLK